MTFIGPLRVGRVLRTGGNYYRLWNLVYLFEYRKVLKQNQTFSSIPTNLYFI